MGAQSLTAFLFSLFIFYWSFPLLALRYASTTIFRFTGPRNDTYKWSCLMRDFFRLKLLKYGSNSLYKGKVLYLSNHRSWADFFVDVHLTQGNACIMSRWLVFFVFPVFMTSVKILKTVLLFKRGTIADKKVFNEWLDSQLAAALGSGLLVYPEGHRSTLPTSLPLKRGMLYYAHSRGLPVQILISKGKEAVMSEKQKSCGWGATVVTGFSEVLETKGVEFEAFWTKCQATWDKLWADVYAADPAKLPPLVQDTVPEFEYPPEMKQQQLAAGLVSLALLGATLWGAAKLVLLVTGVLGAVVQKVLLTGLLGWLVSSVLSCQLPQSADT